MQGVGKWSFYKLPGWTKYNILKIQSFINHDDIFNWKISNMQKNEIAERNTHIYHSHRFASYYFSIYVLFFCICFIFLSFSHTHTHILKKEIKQNLYLSFYLSYTSNFFFWPCHMACGILLLPRGIKPAPHELETWSLNHWRAKKVPTSNFWTMMVIYLKFSNQMLLIFRFLILSRLASLELGSLFLCLVSSLLNYILPPPSV